jgi:TatD DNase family protein
MDKYINIFDTHSHYDDEQFNDDRSSLLSSLPDKGVMGLVTCGVDIESSYESKRLSDEFDYIYFAAGFHPENLEGFELNDIAKIERLAQNEKCVAIGEIGLDYHWMSSTKEKQKAFFEAQIELAKRLDMPIIVHDREAHGDTLDILKRTKPKGVLHCLSGSTEMARDIINIGMYIGLNGVATFRNARKSLEVVKKIPLERLVLETDCPYLCPEPYRGRRNDSSYIPFIAQRIGEVLSLPAQEVLDITMENALRLYNL